MGVYMYPEYKLIELFLTADWMEDPYRSVLYNQWAIKRIPILSNQNRHSLERV